MLAAGEAERDATEHGGTFLKAQIFLIHYSLTALFFFYMSVKVSLFHYFSRGK